MSALVRQLYCSTSTRRRFCAQIQKEDGTGVQWFALSLQNKKVLGLNLPADQGLSVWSKFVCRRLQYSGFFPLRWTDDLSKVSPASRPVPAGTGSGGPQRTRYALNVILDIQNE